jgi:hypothetical protein
MSGSTPRSLSSGFDLRSMALAVGGGLVVLLIYGLVTKGRA